MWNTREMLWYIVNMSQTSFFRKYFLAHWCCIGVWHFWNAQAVSKKNMYMIFFFSILIKQIEVWKVSIDDWLYYSRCLLSFFVLSQAYYLENGMRNIQLFFFLHIIILSKWKLRWIIMLEIIQTRCYKIIGWLDALLISKVYKTE